MQGDQHGWEKEALPVVDSPKNSGMTRTCNNGDASWQDGDPDIILTTRLDIKIRTRPPGGGVDELCRPRPCRNTGKSCRFSNIVVVCKFIMLRV